MSVADMARQAAVMDLTNQLEKMAEDLDYGLDEFQCLAAATNVAVPRLVKFAYEQPREFDQWLDKQAASAAQKKQNVDNKRQAQKLRTDVNAGRKTTEQASEAVDSAHSGFRSSPQGQAVRSSMGAASGPSGRNKPNVQSLLSLGKRKLMSSARNTAGRMGTKGKIAAGLTGLAAGGAGLYGLMGSGSEAPQAAPLPAKPQVAQATPKPASVPNVVDVPDFRSGGGGVGVASNVASSKPPSVPNVVDVPDYRGGGAADSMIAAKGGTGTSNAAGGGIGGDIQSRVSQLAAWAKQKPELAALLGIGTVGAGYGLSRLMSGDDEKEGSDSPYTFKHRLIKKAGEVRRHNARVIMNRFLTKVASDPATKPVVKIAFAKIEQSLADGHNIHTALRVGFPKLAAERRGMLAVSLAKRAMDDFAKSTNPKKSQPQSFTGSPSAGVSWMKQH